MSSSPALRRWRGAAGLGVAGAFVASALIAPTAALAADEPDARVVAFDTDKTLAQNGWTGVTATSPTFGDAQVLSASSFRLSNWLNNVADDGVQTQLIAPVTTSAGEDLPEHQYSYAFTVDSAYKVGSVRKAQPKLAVEAAVGDDGNRAGGNLVLRVPTDGHLELTNYSDPSAGGSDADGEWVGTRADVLFNEPLVVVYTVDFVDDASDVVTVYVYGTTSAGGVDYADRRATFTGGSFEYYHEWAGNGTESANGLAFRAVHRAPNVVTGGAIEGWVTEVPDTEQRAFLKDKGLVFSNIAYGTTAIAGITGTPLVGKKLVAVGNVAPGDSKVAYQWYRGDAKISGATKSTYVPVSADVGKTLKVTIAVKSGSTTVSSVSSAQTDPVGAILAIGLPETTGLLTVGSVLSVTKPDYNVATTFSYQWYRDAVAIKGATKATYTLGAADRGTAITVKLTAKKKNYASLALTSVAVDTVDWGTLSVSALPTVAGTKKVGKTLTATSNGWSVSKPTKLYYWYASNGVDPVGVEDLVQVGTSNKLKLTALHKGKVISVRVEGFKTGFGPGLIESGLSVATTPVG